MQRLSVLLVTFFLAGCSALSLRGEDANNPAPLVCSPEHTQLPCAGGAELGHPYRFDLLTHCGIEWAYFDGRYWVPRPNVDKPTEWEGIEAGTMVLKRPGVALFEASKGGTVRFATAAASYHPRDCE
jgi:hypothetical protein